MTGHDQVTADQPEDRGTAAAQEPEQHEEPAPDHRGPDVYAPQVVGQRLEAGAFDAPFDKRFEEQHAGDAERLGKVRVDLADLGLALLAHVEGGLADPARGQDEQGQHGNRNEHQERAQNEHRDQRPEQHEDVRDEVENGVGNH